MKKSLTRQCLKGLLIALCAIRLFFQSFLYQWGWNHFFFEGIRTSFIRLYRSDYFSISYATFFFRVATTFLAIS